MYEFIIIRSLKFSLLNTKKIESNISIFFCNTPCVYIKLTTKVITNYQYH